MNLNSLIASSLDSQNNPELTSVDAGKLNLLGLSREALVQFFAEMGEKPFRAQQLMKWLYHRGVSDFDQMTDMSKTLRTRLEAVACIIVPEIVVQNYSTDGTRKWVMRMPGGSAIETVYIPDGGRGTLCVSSQIGCAVDCSFCSTGKQGFNRNLTAAEIIGQMWIAAHSFGSRDVSSERYVTNVVFMGMGEPLLNYQPVLNASRLMMDDLGFGIGKRRLTISTSGVVPAIDQLGEDTDVSLAISLHAPNDELRDVLVPLNRKYPIATLLAACRRYLDKLPDKRKITIEYTLMKDVNDSPEQAVQLAAVLGDLPVKINLIPFNPFPNSGYERPSRNAAMRFSKILQEAGHIATIRTTRGDDIDAACGQLVGQVEDRTRRQARWKQQNDTAAGI